MSEKTDWIDRLGCLWEAETDAAAADAQDVHEALKELVSWAQGCICDEQTCACDKTWCETRPWAVRKALEVLDAG